MLPEGWRNIPGLSGDEHYRLVAESMARGLLSEARSLPERRAPMLAGLLRYIARGREELGEGGEGSQLLRAIAEAVERLEDEPTPGS